MFGGIVETRERMEETTLKQDILTQPFNGLGCKTVNLYQLVLKMD